MKNFTTILLSCSMMMSVLGNTPATVTVNLDVIFSHVLRLGENLTRISSKLDHTVLALTSQLDNTKSNLQKTKSTLMATKSTLEKTSLALSSVSSRLASVEDNMRDKDSHLMNLTKVLGRLHSRVSYQVTLQTNPMVVRHKEILKFDTVLQNNGGGYNRLTGIFTAPVSGTYLFWCNIQSDDTDSFYIQLKKNGVLMINSEIPEGVRFGHATITCSTDLTTGDTVWFDNYEKGSLTKIDGALYSSYGGLLLNPVY